MQKIANPLAKLKAWAQRPGLFRDAGRGALKSPGYSLLSLGLAGGSTGYSLYDGQSITQSLANGAGVGLMTAPGSMSNIYRAGKAKQLAGVAGAQAYVVPALKSLAMKAALPSAVAGIESFGAMSSAAQKAKNFLTNLDETTAKFNAPALVGTTQSGRRRVLSADQVEKNPVWKRTLQAYRDSQQLDTGLPTAAIPDPIVSIHETDSPSDSFAAGAAGAGEGMTAAGGGLTTAAGSMDKANKILDRMTEMLESSAPALARTEDFTRKAAIAALGIGGVATLAALINALRKRKDNDDNDDSTPVRPKKGVNALASNATPPKRKLSKRVVLKKPGEYTIHLTPEEAAMLETKQSSISPRSLLLMGI